MNLRNLIIIFCTTLLYCISGKLGLLLAIPPGYATAVYPAAGFAFACVFYFGYRAAIGVFLGSLLVNLDPKFSTWEWVNTLPIIWIACGAAMQAAFAKVLVEHLVGKSKNILTQEINVIYMFLYAGPVACLFNASWSIYMLVLSKKLLLSEAWFNWFTWWVGDSIGVLLFSQIFLVWTVRPYKQWFKQQLQVSLPLIALFFLVVVGFFTAAKYEKKSLDNSFQSNVDKTVLGLEKEFSNYYNMLTTLSAFLSEDGVNKNNFENFSNKTLEYIPGIYAIAIWEKLKTDEEKAKFLKERNVSSFKIFKHTGAGISDGTIYGDYFVVKFTQTQYKTKNIEGLIVNSEKNRAEALRQADNVKIAITDPIQIVGKDSQQEVGFLMVNKIDKQKNSLDNKENYIVFVIKVEDFFKNFKSELNKSGIEYRIENSKEPLIFFGTNIEKMGERFLEKNIKLANKDLKIRFVLTNTYVLSNKSWALWMVLGGGLVIVAMLGLFLLVVSGRQNKIESEVSDRTKELQGSEKKFRELLHSAPDALVIVNSDGLIEICNHQTEKFFGYMTGDMHLQKIDILIPDGFSYFDHQNLNQSTNLLGKRKDGTFFPIEISFSPTFIDKKACVIATIRDVSERKKTEEYVEHLANHDLLTNLPNRYLMNKRMKEAFIQSSIEGSNVGIMMVDLDHFKKINDSLGHGIGDLLLKEVADRLRKSVRSFDTVARMGGDEFLIILPNIDFPEDMVMIAEKIKKIFEIPFFIKDHTLMVGVSIGIAISNSQESESDIIKNADLAMYEAKKKGRGGFEWFNKHMLDEAFIRLDFEQRFNEAINNNELVVYYQPIVSIHNNSLFGFEALTRWDDPKRGMVYPDSFIALAEESGLIIPMTNYVIKKAFADIKKLQTAHNKNYFLTVNLSPKQFSQVGLVDFIKEQVAKNDLSYQSLVFEITESLLITKEKEAKEILSQLAALGIRIAIDDFGTGFSSLSYISKYMLHKIKIDKSFVKEIGVDQKTNSIVKAIIAMSHSLGLKVIAEGVETQEQYDFLKKWDCNEIQGFYFGKAEPVEKQYDFKDRKFIA